MGEKGNIENSIANCSFVLTNENKTAVAIQDNKYDAFLINIMEEFRLIETGSKKPGGK